MTMMEDDRDADRLKTDSFFPKKPIKVPQSDARSVPQEIIERAVFDAMLRKVRGMKIPYLKIRDKYQEYHNQAIDEVLKVLDPNGSAAPEEKK